MKLFFLYFLITIISLVQLLQAEIVSEVTLESKAFTHDAFTKESGNYTGSFEFKAEYFHSFDSRNEQLVFSPYVRLDSDDKERNLFDLREGYWQKDYNSSSVSIGFKRVFWGATESIHLVDILNQTDLLGSVDGEDKFGQPMVEFSFMHNLGYFDFYLLPYFRERTFAGLDGRLRSSVSIDNDNTTYQSSTKKWHQDFALRWSNSIGITDIGISYFEGIDRQPDFKLSKHSDGSLQLQAYYLNVSRVSFDLTVVSDGWLLKMEGFTQEQNSHRGTALVGGFEYTFTGLFGSRTDFGFLSEYMYDDRGRNKTPFDNDIFIGGRFVLNDIGGTTFLAGTINDVKNGSYLLLVEGERRLTDWWFLEIEMRLFSNQKSGDLLYDLRDDDFIQTRITRHF